MSDNTRQLQNHHGGLLMSTGEPHTSEKPCASPQFRLPGKSRISDEAASLSPSCWLCGRGLCRPAQHQAGAASSLNGRVSAGKAGTPLVMRDFPWQHLETGAWGGLGPRQPGFLLTPSSSSTQAKCFSCPHTVPPRPQGGTVRKSRVKDCQPHTPASP